MVMPASQWAPRPCSGVAGFPWNQWQLCYGISGNFRVEQVAALAWNRWQLWRGIRTTTPTAQRITPRTGEDTLTVGLPCRDTILPFDQPPECYHQPCEHLLHLLGLTRGMETIIANAVKPFRQNMLCHPPDKREGRDLFFLPLLGFVIVIPIAHPLPIIAQDASQGDRGTHDIFRQVVR